VRRATALTALSLPFCLFAGVANGAPATPSVWSGWEAQSDQPRTYRIDGFTFKTSVRRGDDTATPVLVVSSKGRPPLRVAGAVGVSRPYAGFLVFPTDRPRGQAVILFRSYTGGAHCCDEYKLIEPTPAGWRVHAIGNWDGSGPEPHDVDRDGRLELVARDQRFDYRLTSHAESVMPPVVFVVRDGKLADVTKEPRFRRLFTADLPKLRKACEDSESPLGPCLGYVAVAARAGEAKSAFQVLDGKPQGTEVRDWELPEQCGGSPAGCANEKPTRSFKDRHAAVVHFLTDLGYLREAAK
jgi:hypothetical protein